MNKPKVIIFLVLVVLFTIILTQNTHVITLNLLFWEVNTSTFYIPLIIVISVGVGYLAAKITVKNKNKDDISNS